MIKFVLEQLNQFVRRHFVLNVKILSHVYVVWMVTFCKINYVFNVLFSVLNATDLIKMNVIYVSLLESKIHVFLVNKFRVYIL